MPGLQPCLCKYPASQMTSGVLPVPPTVILPHHDHRHTETLRASSLFDTAGAVLQRRRQTVTKAAKQQGNPVLRVPVAIEAKHPAGKVSRVRQRATKLGRVMFSCAATSAPSSLTAAARSGRQTRQSAGPAVRRQSSGACDAGSVHHASPVPIVDVEIAPLASIVISTFSVRFPLRPPVRRLRQIHLELGLFVEGGRHHRRKSASGTPRRQRRDIDNTVVRLGGTRVHAVISPDHRA